MNYRIIVYFLGQVMRLEAFTLIIPFIIAVYLRETTSITGFAATIILLLILSLPVIYRKPQKKVLHAKEGLLIVALSWLFMSFFGALPFYLSGAIPSFVDGFFESVSGFTTTGASILTDIESLPMSILFWRSFTHWMGGLGVLVFIITIISMVGGNTLHLMRAESPGPSTDKFVPKMSETAKILYLIYFFLTFAEIILLYIGGMSLFDSITTSFGTAATGGFSVRNASIAAYNSVYIQGVITVFMLLFGVNFSVYFLIYSRKFLKAIKFEEFLIYLAIVATAMIAVIINIYGNVYQTLGEAIRYGTFQVASIITTTGYATADFNLWPQFSRVLLLFIMFIGACAGSTGGGIKVARFVLVYKSAKKEIHKMIHPRSVETISFNGKSVDETTLNGVTVYLIFYFIIFIISNLLLAFEGVSFETTFSAVTACINNIGPGLDMVGATGNYAFFSIPSKLILIFNMLAGRLEIFPVLMLFVPGAWRLGKNKQKKDVCRIKT